MIRLNSCRLCAQTILPCCCRAPLCLLLLLILWCHHEQPAAYGCMCLSAGCRLRWHSFFNLHFFQHQKTSAVPSCLHLQLPCMIRLDSPRRPGDCQQDIVPFPAEVLKNKRPASNTATGMCRRIRAFSGQLIQIISSVSYVQRIKQHIDPLDEKF